MMHKLHEVPLILTRTTTKIVLIVLLTGILAVPGVSFAAIYYISPNGDDANPGTIDAPWQTLEYAWFVLAAGDTLRLMDGTHLITGETGMNDNTATRDARITIEAASGANPIVKGSMNFDDRTKLWITNYMTVRNITFIDNGHFPLLIRGSEVVVENCTFHNCLNFMYTDPVNNFVLRNNDFWFDHPGGFSGVRTRAVSGVIEHNTFHWTETGSAYGGIITWGQAKNIEIRYNKFIGIPNATNRYSGECIWLGGYFTNYYGVPANNGEWESVNINVHDNIMIYMPLAALGISHARDCSFYNNTYYNSGYTDWVVGIWGVLNDKDGNPTDRDPALYHNPKNITIKNNIFYTGYPGTDKHIFHVHPNCDEGLAVNNNVWYTGDISNTKVWWTWDGLIPIQDYINISGQDTTSVLADPLLKDPANADVHLLSGSPAIDAGTDTLYSPVDLDGNARPYASTLVDIGAYEYIGPTQVLEGDFNGDGVVDIKDLILVAKDYGTTYNISHIILVAKNYGRTL